MTHHFVETLILENVFCRFARVGVVLVLASLDACVDVRDVEEDHGCWNLPGMLVAGMRCRFGMDTHRVVRELRFGEIE